MAITLSSTDYDRLLQAANPDPIDPHSHNRLQVIPPQLGRGYMQHISLHGIQLCLFNYQLDQDLCVVGRSIGSIDTGCELGFHLSGERSGRRKGENFLYWGEDDDIEPEDWHWNTSAKEPVLKVDIHLETADRLFQLITDCLPDPPVAVCNSLEADQSSFGEVNTITSAMRVVLEQILNCPFQGQTQQIYLEAKCLELIVLKLEQLKQTEKSAPLPCTLKPDDIDRIHWARQLLVERLANPPSLLELARQVGLNDYKLKIGFREVVGTTVFGYLHQQRMETARQLLRERRLNVREVAQSVGYANQSRFAAAFRKQFGINPKSYCLAEKSR